MKMVVARIRKLENRYGSVIQAQRKANGPSGAAVIAAALAHLGISRGPNESLAETTARAMGISVRELRVQLQRRAAAFTAGRFSYRYLDISGRVTQQEIRVSPVVPE